MLTINFIVLYCYQPRLINLLIFFLFLSISTNFIEHFCLTPRKRRRRYTETYGHTHQIFLWTRYVCGNLRQPLNCPPPYNPNIKIHLNLYHLIKKKSWKRRKKNHKNTPKIFPRATNRLCVRYSDMVTCWCCCHML